MERKNRNERFFSVELQSKAGLKSVTMMKGPCDNILVEGTIGKLVQVDFIEEIVLEVVGKKGTLRIDVGKGEVAEKLQKCSIQNSDASCAKNATRSSKGGDRNVREI